jgi:hypothetical protein
MPLHPTTFGFLKPNQAGIDKMAEARAATTEYAKRIEEILTDGPDKTYILRKVREIGMWALVSVTREADGTPRPEYSE